MAELESNRPLPVSRYYLDESGNSGDLARSGAQLDFAGQEMFALACVGVDDEDALGCELTRLAERYRVRSTEISSMALRKKPDFVSDLITYLIERDLPVMIELVDKRFMVAANIVNTLVMPPVGACDTTLEAQWLRNVLAEYIHITAPASVLTTYLAACDAPSIERLKVVFQTLIGWAEVTPPSDVAKAVRDFAIDSYGDFLEEADGDECAWQRYLPLPDQNKRGQSIWMLPNLTSLTNVYARINRRHGRRVGNITLIHDEQAHFEAILENAKGATERLVLDDAVPPQRVSDYHFEESATLAFARSGRTFGIQAADVLAGFVMRYAKRILYEGHVPSPAERKAFSSLLVLSDPERAEGVNYVLASADMLRLGAIPI